MSGARAETLLRQLTPEQQVGQLFLIRCPQEEEEAVIRRYQPGGLVLFSIDFEDRTAAQCQSRMEALQRVSRVPMIVSADEEGGTVCRVSRQKQLLQKGDKSLRGERVKALKDLFRGELERRSGAVRTRARCSVRERNWLNNYRHAKAYAKRRGDLLVPASYVDETGFRLGVWISNLRAARKTRPDSFQVTPEHIAMLDEIGMQWDAREAKWQCALRRAGEYRAAHGDLAVPVNYKTEDGFCLGDWIRRMRESYAAHDARLTPERVENLSALGMVWAPAEG